MPSCTEDFIKESTLKFGGKFDYTNTIYKNAKLDVELHCNEHGYDFKINPINHLKSKDGCSKDCKLHGIGLKRMLEYEKCKENNLPYKKHKCTRCKGELDDFFANVHIECRTKNKINFEKRKGHEDLDENVKFERCLFKTKGGDQCKLSSQNGTLYCKVHTIYADKGVDEKSRCKDCGSKKENEGKRLCNKCNENRNNRSMKKRKIMKSEKLDRELEILEEYEISPYYVSGFFDGDGSICITQGLSLQVMFSQCVKSVLLKLQNIFGGTIYTRNMDHDTNRRDQHSLRICGKDCEKIFKYLLKGSIMKLDQIKIGIKMLNMIDMNGLEDEKIKLREQMRDLNKEYKKTHNKEYNRINWEYIAGLFDAEGCLYLKAVTRQDKSVNYKFVYIKITQKNDYKLLDAIKVFTGHGNTSDKTSWIVNRIDFAKYDLNKILPYLIVKKEQAELCIELFDCDDKDRRREIYEETKFLKKIDNTIL